jgi:hypothetical protein
MDLRDGRQRSPFLEALEQDQRCLHKGWNRSHLYVELGLYCDQVARYLETFGRENVLVVFFEELVEDPGRELDAIMEFLGIDSSAVDATELGAHNPYATPRNQLLQRIVPIVKRFPPRRYLPRRLRRFVWNRLLLRDQQKEPPDPKAIDFLQTMYRSDVACLERLLRRRVPWHRWSGKDD